MPELGEVREKTKKPPKRCGRLDGPGGLPCRDTPVARVVLNWNGVRILTVACQTHLDELQNGPEAEAVLEVTMLRRPRPSDRTRGRH